jgi:hypothetical protein
MVTSLTYTSHQADAWDGPGEVALREHYGDGDVGWAMNARYLAICGIVARSEGVRLDLGDEVNRGYVRRKLDLVEEKLEELLVTIDKCRLGVYQEHILTIHSVDDDLARRTTASEAAQRAAAKRYGKSAGDGSPPRPRAGQSKGAQSKASAAGDSSGTASADTPPRAATTSVLKEQKSGANSSSEKQAALSGLQPAYNDVQAAYNDAQAAYARNEGMKEVTKREEAINASSLFVTSQKNIKEAGSVDEDLLTIAKTWGPLFEWAERARQGRGLQENPLQYFRASSIGISNGDCMLA